MNSRTVNSPIFVPSVENDVQGDRLQPSFACLEVVEGKQGSMAELSVLKS